MIEAVNLTKRYPMDISKWKRAIARMKREKPDRSVPAVDRLNMKVERGEVYGFIGPNGAGKTTTIKMLIGLMPPSSGSATVCGFDVKEEAHRVLGKIGYMPEIPAFYPRVSVLDSLKYCSKLYRIPASRIPTRIDRALNTVGLSDEKKKKCGKLSFGMKKRLSLAHALINEPELLILDEPTGGLDPMGKRDFRHLLKELSERDITIFMSSHLLAEVQKICTHVGIINKGRLRTSGSMEELQKKISERAKVRMEIKVMSAAKIPLAMIRQTEGIIDVKVSGNTMTVMASKEGVSSEINGMLVKNDCPVRSIVIEEPELEDIFFDYTLS